jgi:GNAT superfamily N-acetyltransferase
MAPTNSLSIVVRSEDNLVHESIVEVSEQDHPEERELIEHALRAYNARSAPPANYLPLRLTIRDSEGAVMGGLIGHSAYDWLFISVLFIPEALRGKGVGRKLMERAEQIARTRKLTGIWLDTFDFQARPFYEKLGFSVFGELKDHPRGISQYWLQKRLD